MEKIKVLLVEDDRNLAYMLKEYLEMKNFLVSWAQDGAEGEALLSRNTFDICILDIMLPKEDGFTIAGKIGQTYPGIPIIFLSAKSMKVDKLKGFNLGCDDYIVKPVDEEELIARILAVVKRSSRKEQQQKETIFRFGHTMFDYHAQTLLHFDQRQQLTNKESQVLFQLVHHQNSLLKRRDVLKKVWGEDDYFNRRSMDVVISKLRKHLAPDTLLQIRNIHGQGYILQVQEE